MMKENQKSTAFELRQKWLNYNTLGKLIKILIYLFSYKMEGMITTLVETCCVPHHPSHPF